MRITAKLLRAMSDGTGIEAVEFKLVRLQGANERARFVRRYAFRREDTEDSWESPTGMRASEAYLWLQGWLSRRQYEGRKRGYMVSEY